MPKNIDEYLIEKGLFITAISSVVIILLIIVFIFWEGYPILNIGFFDFLFGMEWSLQTSHGIFP